MSVFIVIVFLLARPAGAVVNGAVVPGGWRGDVPPVPNPYAFVGRVILPGDVGCTATLVAPSLALTAGHCAGHGTITFGLLNADRDRGETRTMVAWGYQGDAPGLLGLGDMLLVRLDQPVLDIRPVALGSPADSRLWATGSQVTALGWGQINDTRNGSGIWTRELRSAQLKVRDTAISLPPFRGLMKLSSVSGHPTHGDSGGPVFATDPSGRIVQFGVDEGATGLGGYYYNRTWPDKAMLDYVASHQ